MQVTCPGCQSRFNLPPAVRPGSRLRCSVCRNVFVYGPEPEPEPASIDLVPDDDGGLSLTPGNAPAREGSSHTGLWALLFIAAIALAGYFGWHFWAQKNALQPQSGQAVTAPAVTTATAAGQEASVGMLTMRNVSQYFVANDQVGRILAIKGTVFNQFVEPRAGVRGEAVLIDRDNRVLESKLFAAGATLTDMQLQRMDKVEIEALLTSPVAAGPGTVVPGGEIPFMVVFYNPPEGVAEFAVRIVDAVAVTPAERPAQPAASPAGQAPAGDAGRR